MALIPFADVPGRFREKVVPGFASGNALLLDSSAFPIGKPRHTFPEMRSGIGGCNP
jgi:hypothetical protein